MCMGAHYNVSFSVFEFRIVLSLKYSLEKQSVNHIDNFHEQTYFTSRKGYGYMLSFISDL